jgi:hypothetical protein
LVNLLDRNLAMNSILEAFVEARRAAPGPKVREVEAYYQLTSKALGIESVEALTARSRRDALRRDFNEL